MMTPKFWLSLENFLSFDVLPEKLIQIAFDRPQPSQSACEDFARHMSIGRRGRERERERERERARERERERRYRERERERER